MAVNITRGKVFSGARAFISVDGRVLSFATGCSGSERIIYEPVDTMDRLEIAEWVPVGYVVGFNAMRVRQIGDGSNENGSLREALGTALVPKHGTTSDEFLRNLVLPKGTTGSVEKDIVLTDRVTDKIFMVLENGRAESWDWTVPKGIVQENVSFVGTRILDDTEMP